MLRKKNTILIVDEHPSVRSGLSALIETVPDMDVIGDAYDCSSAVHAANRLKPDVIILDMMSASRNGIGIVRELRRASPHSQILILTDYDSSDQVLDIIQAGVRGYLLKDPLSADIASAIRNILNGKVIIHRDIARSLTNKSERPAKQSSNSIPEFVQFP